MQRYIRAADGSMISFAQKAKKTFKPVTAASQNGSTARALANTVADLLKKASGEKIRAKVSIQGRDAYKITWWFVDMPAVKEFVSYVKDKIAIAEDELAYDVSGMPILPSATADKGVSPMKLMKHWVSSGNFQTLAATYGLAQTSRLYITSKVPELTGSNARDWERLTGEKPISPDTAWFMTIHVEQIGEVNKVTDQAWAIKCLDMLFRHNEIYEDGKKRYAKYTRQPWEMSRKGNKFYFNLFSDTTPDESANIIESRIQIYYPEFESMCELDASDNQIILTVK